MLIKNKIKIIVNNDIGSQFIFKIYIKMFKLLYFRFLKMTYIYYKFLKNSRALLIISFSISQISPFIG